MRIEEDFKLDFDDVLIRPKRSVLGSRKDVDLVREFTFKWSEQTYKGIPIIAANMDTVGTFEMALALDKFKLGTALHKHYLMKDIAKFYVEHYHASKAIFYSMGILEADLLKLEEFLYDPPPYICVDVANGYSERFADSISKIRGIYPDSTIMAGNVVTAEMTEQLILSGADIVKVGIGPGSVCTTRKITGVGYPQLSAIMECADAAHGLNGLICADGGCKVPGDVAKAFGAGADFVMLGGMLAGHDESGGQRMDIPDPPGSGNVKTVMEFYGMSSETAMNKYAGGVAEYRASEGKLVQVDYKGPVENTVQSILGGLRSACTYTGARRLKDLSKCTTFVKVNRQLNTVYGN